MLSIDKNVFINTNHGFSLRDTGCVLSEYYIPAMYTIQNWKFPLY